MSSRRAPIHCQPAACLAGIKPAGTELPDGNLLWTRRAGRPPSLRRQDVTLRPAAAGAASRGRTARAVDAMIPFALSGCALGDFER